MSLAEITLLKDQVRTSRRERVFKYILTKFIKVIFD